MMAHEDRRGKSSTAESRADLRPDLGLVMAASFAFDPVAGT